MPCKGQKDAGESLQETGVCFWLQLGLQKVNQPQDKGNLLIILQKISISLQLHCSASSVRSLQAKKRNNKTKPRNTHLLVSFANVPLSFPELLKHYVRKSQEFYQTKQRRIGAVRGTELVLFTVSSLKQWGEIVQQEGGGAEGSHFSQSFICPLQKRFLLSLTSIIGFSSSWALTFRSSSLHT